MQQPSVIMSYFSLRVRSTLYTPNKAKPKAKLKSTILVDYLPFGIINERLL